VRALFERLWWNDAEPAWAEAALFPLSLLSLGWRAGRALHRRSSTPFRAGVPVVSVGNLGAGGAGKTPVALLVCEALRKLGRRPALLSRGYGGRLGREVGWVCKAGGPLLDAEVAGDEPVLCARRAPWLLVLAGRDRRLLAEAACEAGAGVLVLDDGLQQLALARDLDLVVADQANPLGNGRLLPRGPLRELPSSLERVGGRGLLWLTGSEAALQPRAQGFVSLAARCGLRGPVRSSFVASGPEVDRLRGQAVVALSGIARPERFHALLRSAGARLLHTRAFGDHHRFSLRELESARALARREGALLVTTEKDAARLGSLLGEIVVLRGEPRLLEGREVLQAALAALWPAAGAHP
jgi:tetraacyldisaccharide 4'-kinase